MIEQILLGLGCFWAVERVFRQHGGVYTTAVGYSGGVTPNPSCEEVCPGKTGHTEAVPVVFPPSKIALTNILKMFLEAHVPTHEMRKGNDLGSQYRSAIYTFLDRQYAAAQDVVTHYQEALSSVNQAKITTELIPRPEFYYAEQYHQQYLAKKPNGYCGIGGAGVSCPI